jgi:DNA-binding beta-propeller fold protein YncE
LGSPKPLVISVVAVLIVVSSLTGAYANALLGIASVGKPLILTSPRSQYAGSLGISSAISSDGNYVAVGTLEKAGTSQDAGRVYLFDSHTGEVIRSFISPNNQPYGAFGSSVALRGAQTETVNNVGQGKAFLFNVTQLLHSFTSSHPRKDDFFGVSVALTGNGLAVVGSGLEEVKGFRASGRVYVFDTTSGSLVRALPIASQLAQEFGGHWPRRVS